MLGQEHRAIEFEVNVVDARIGIEVERSVFGQELQVGFDCSGIPHHHVVVMPALKVDMRRHVVQVSAVGNDAAQLVSGPQGGLGDRRHFHHVNVAMQQAGMAFRALLFHRSNGVFQDLACFQRGCTFTGLASVQIPQTPGRACHQRFGGQRADIGAVAVCLVRRSHGIGIGVGPHGKIRWGLIGGMPLGNRLDQLLFQIGGRILQRHRALGGFVGFLENAGKLDGIELGPAAVVDRATGIGDAPPGHGAIGVGVGSPLEAAQRFLEIEAIGPGQPAIKPGLRQFGGCRDLHRMAAGIVVIVQHDLPALTVPGMLPRMGLTL